MSSHAIRTEALTKRYADTIAVDGLDLEVTKGTVSCLLGPNGSGKTTTVAMLTTLRRPTSGTAVVCGHDIVAQPAAVRSLIGVTMQHTGVDELMTGTEILSLQAALQGLSRRAGQRRIGDLVELLDLGSHIDTRLQTWSGGLRRRLDLAAALVHSPQLLFLDEPTTGLDPSSRRGLWSEIRRLNREEGVTVLLTTQYLEEADALAGEITIIQAGAVVTTGSPQTLKRGLGERTLILEMADPDSAQLAQNLVGGSRTCEHPEVLRVVAEPADVLPHFARVTDAGIDVVGLTIVEPSLEDVFLHLTEVA